MSPDEAVNYCENEQEERLKFEIRNSISDARMEKGLTIKEIAEEVADGIGEDFPYLLNALNDIKKFVDEETKRYPGVYRN